MATLGKRIWRWIATLFATVVILLAVALGIFRLMLPLVPEYHDQLQAWASSAVGLPVKIEKVDARWRLKGPELFFSNAEVFSQDGSEVLIRAASGSVGVSLFGLIRERQLQAGWVELSGARVYVQRSVEGKYHLRGYEPGGEPAPRRGDARLVIPKGSFELIDAEIRYQDDASKRDPWIFRDVDLHVRYHGDSLRLDGQVGLPPSLGSEIELAVEAQGDLSDPDSLDWQLLFSGEAVSLGGWREILPFDTPLVDGFGDASLWLAMVDGRFQQATATVDLGNLIAMVAPAQGRAPTEFRLSHLAGTFKWDRQNQGWTALARDFRLALGGNDWPASQIELEYREADDTGSARIRTNADFLRLDELNQFLVLVPRPDTWPDLSGIRLTGEIRNIKAEFHTATETKRLKYEIDAEFDRFGVITPDDLPQATGLTGKTRMTNVGGEAELATREFSFRLPKTFRNDLTLGQVDGKLDWHINDELIRLSTDAMTVSNPDLNLSVAAEFVYQRQGGPPQLDLQANLADVDLSRLSTYLTSGIPSKVLKWLDTGVLDGRLRSGRFVFDGPLQRRPFDTGEARMLIHLTVEDAKIDYFPGWPLIEQLDADITIEDATLTALVHSALLNGAQIEYAVARIRNMYESPLEVSGTATGTLDQLIDFVKNSPLIDHLGDKFNDLQAQGRGFIEADMSVRLREWHENEFNIGVQIDEGVVGFEGMRQRFMNVAGRLNASMKGLDGEEIAATLLGRPVTIDLFPLLAEDGEREATIMTVAGKSDMDSALNALNLPIASYVDGAADWNARVRFPRKDLGTGEQFRIDVKSALSGVAVDLPAPLSKRKVESRPLTLGFVFSDDATVNVDMHYGQDARGLFRLNIDDAGWHFDRGAAAFGDAEPVLPLTGGVVVTGTVRDLNLDQWLQLEADTPPRRPIHDVLTSVDLKIGLLDFYRQVLADARFQLNHNNREWLVQIDSEPIAGSLFVPFDLSGNAPIVANMSRFVIVVPESDESRNTDSDPRDLPAMEITAEDFTLGDRRLGALKASIVRVPEGITLQHFESLAPSFTTRGAGEWLYVGGQHQSALRLALESTDVRQSAQYLGYAGSVTGNKGEAVFDIFWPGTPTGEFLSILSGTASINIENGQMTDLEPGAGRIFGLLSVTALPRRLSLDFRDVFEKGFGFDRISGEFQINQGNAFTENLVLKGPAADVGIVGRIGLAEEDYDQIAIVNAKIGHALPVAGVLAAGPAIGAALLILTEMLRDPLGELMQLQYKITGSWEDPLVERVDVSQAAAEKAGDTPAFP